MPRAKKKTISDGFTRWGEWPPVPQKPEREVGYEEWKTVLEGKFPYLWKYNLLCASVQAQLLIKPIKQPFPLVFVGPPSSGKSQLLNIQTLNKDLGIMSDKLSGPVFLTGASGKTEEELERIDLLPKIRHRTLYIKDLAPIFGASEDVLKATIAQLTRVLDGKGLCVDLGSQPRREKEGDFRFMLLAATTPVPGRVWDIMSKMGPRLLFVHMRMLEATSASIHKAIRTDDCEMEDECRKVNNLFFLTMWDRSRSGVGSGWKWNFNEASDEVCNWIERASLLVCAGRANQAECDSEQYLREEPYRVPKMLRNLSIGHALIHDRYNLTLDDVAPVLEVAVETSRENVGHVTRTLIRGSGRATTTMVMQTMKCTHTTAIAAMEQASKMGIGILGDDCSRPGKPQKVLTTAFTKFAWMGYPETKRVMWPDPSAIEVDPEPYSPE